MPKKRAQAPTRKHTKSRPKKRSYEAASFGRRMQGWYTPRTSVNVENKTATMTLRDRVRDLVRNSPYASRALHAIVGNTVGAGVLPQIGCEDQTRKKLIQNLWSEWAETKAIDLEGRQDFYSIQAQVLRTIVESGECLVRVIKTKNSSKIPFQLQVLEPDFLDSYREYRLETGYILQGVEFNKLHQRVAYWMFREHPGGFINLSAYSAVSERIPANEVLHIYRTDRPGAVRGVSWFHPCLIQLKDLHEYQQAVLQQQKLANCFTIFVRKPDTMGEAFTTQAEEISHLEPGLIYHLGLGEDIVFAAPTPPSTTYSEYCNHILKSVASSLGITFECLTQDLSTVNYSSGRMGWLEMSRSIDSWRYQMLVPQLCNPVWALFEQGLKIAGLDTDDCSIRWVPPKRELINPAEELEAYQTAIRNGLTTFSGALREFGEDPETHINELAQDFKKLKALGLKLDCDPSNELKSTNPQPSKGN